MRGQYRLMNRGNAPAQFTVKANAYRDDGPWSYAVDAGMQVAPRWSRAGTHRWYDFTVSVGEHFERRFAGRLENGQDGVSDPAMGV